MEESGKQQTEKYLSKMKGGGVCPPMVSLSEIFWSWVGAFLGISAVAFIHYNMLTETDLVMVVGSFGASAVLIYGNPKSPLAQPWNLIAGHIVSAIIGVACYKLFSDHMWLAAAMAVATAIAAMHVSRSLHAPGGATALIAVVGSTEVHNLGFLYVLVPIGAGAMIMLVVALIVNNIPKSRRYPECWLFPGYSALSHMQASVVKDSKD